MKPSAFARWIALMLCLSVCFVSLASCGKEPPAEDSTAASGEETVISESMQNTGGTGRLSLPYVKGDSLNPFSAKSLPNQLLSTVLYDSLYSVDAALSPQPFLATSGSVSGTQVRVALKSGLVFSDGSSLSASDVVYSFEKAAVSPHYRAQLSNFSGAKVQNGEIVFTLKEADPYALACLDFAVIKRGSDSSETAIPVGSGRYTAVRGDSSVTLKANKAWSGGDKMNFTSITLVDVPDSDSVIHSLEIGNVNFIFNDLSGGVYQRINANTEEFLMNNLVFLGVQSKNELLQNQKVLQAMSLALAREEIASSAYQGHASASAIPFRPDWHALKGLTCADVKQNKEAAVQLLQEAGFDKTNASGARTGNGKALTFTLIVNQGNPFRLSAANLIATQLSAVGIKITVSQLAWADYTKAVQGGSFDLYLGEVKLSNNMSLLPFFEESGSTQAGVNLEGALAAAYHQMLTGAVSLQDFLNSFQESPAFLPICLRKGVAARSRDVQGKLISYSGDVYANLQDWHF
ncbi:MAG: ABC transporter substrate-binding protein [Acutalibacteraceae bacterium]